MIISNINIVKYQGIDNKQNKYFYIVNAIAITMNITVSLNFAYYLRVVIITKKKN